MNRPTLGCMHHDTVASYAYGQTRIRGEAEDDRTLWYKDHYLLWRSFDDLEVELQICIRNQIDRN